MSRRALAATPDGTGSPDWVMTIAERKGMPIATGTARARPAASDLRRRVVDAVLAAKLLAAHMSNRSQLMPIRPTDLSELDEANATLLVRAMAAASHADGGVEAEELHRLEELARSSAIPDERRALLLEELAQPPSIEALVRQVPDARIAERFYAVSAWVIRRERATCRAYLDYLGVRLGLAGDVRLRLDGEVERLASGGRVSR